MEKIKSVLFFQPQVSKTMHKMGLLFLMFILQKIFLCFTWTLLPIILRNQGASLGTIGFTALVYSPWAVKFFYASMVDRFYSRKLGRRKTWIVPLLFLSLVMLFLLSMLSPEENLKLLLAAIFLLNAISATMDIAADGYATDILTADERPWGNTIQTIGYMVAYMLGAGVLLVVYQNQGWNSTLLIITGLQLILMIPVVLHKEIPPVSLKETGEREFVREPVKTRPSARAFIRQPGTLRFALFLVMMAILDQGGALLRLPMLVDKGYDPAMLGRLILWYGTPTSILGSILGARLFKRFGVPRLFILVCVCAGSLSLFSAVISQNPSVDLWQAGMLLGAEKLMTGIVTVMIFSMIMGFSAGPQSATNNAVLNSLLHIAILGLAPVTGRLCDVVGFYHFYMGLGAVGLVILFTGSYLLGPVFGLNNGQG
ncbi:MAG: MFS transporter [Desulfobacteraceae bacterium]|nr:MFS transporter [Desulfobacteraceae bacterium]